MSDEEHPWRRPAGDDRRHPSATAADRTTAQQPVLGLAPWTDPPDPPDQPAAALPPTRSMDALPARHLPRGRAPGAAGPGRKSHTADRLLAVPVGLRIAMVALAAVIVLATAGVFVTAAGHDEDPGAPSPDELGAPGDADAPGVASAPTTSPVPSTTSSTSTVPPSPTSTGAPATTEPSSVPTSTVPAGDPLAACSTGQRNAIERGNHPWSWYVERFDEDGDGILCT
jgi:hypothetical protein